MGKAIRTVKSAWAPKAIPPGPSKTHWIPSGTSTASSSSRIFTRTSCVSLCLTETSFLQMTSWVVLKFQWQKSEQSRRAKALPPADYYCTKSPLEKSGSALTCNFLNKKLSFEGLEKPAPRKLPTDGLGLKRHFALLGQRSITWLHPSKSHTRWACIFLHTKLLAIYANMIF